MSTEDELHRRLVDEFGDPQASGPEPIGDWSSIERRGGARARRRRMTWAAGLAVAVLALGALAVALAGQRSATTTLASTGTGPTSPVSSSTLTTTTTTPAGLVDCGTASLASGWPTTIAQSPTLAQCILGAFATGTPAIYRERAQTDGNGGHIEITIYQVTGPHQVRRTVDATGAQPPGGTTVSVCTGLVAGPDSQLAASGCVAG